MITKEQILLFTTGISRHFHQMLIPDKLQKLSRSSLSFIEKRNKKAV